MGDSVELFAQNSLPQKEASAAAAGLNGKSSSRTSCALLIPTSADSEDEAGRGRVFVWRPCSGRKLAGEGAGFARLGVS